VPVQAELELAEQALLLAVAHYARLA